MRSVWKPVQEAAAVLRPSWLAAVISIAAALALHHAQAVDVLVGIADDEGFFSGEHLLLLVSALTLGLCGWYFPRSILYVEYWFTPKARERFEPWRLWVPRMIGAAPIVSLTIAYLRGGRFGLFVFYAIVSAAFIACLVHRRRLLFPADCEKLGWYPTMPTRTFAAMMSLLVLSLFLLALFLISPVAAPQTIGPIGIILFAMASWIAFGCAALVYPAYRYRLPSLVLLALLLGTVFGTWNDNHQVRLLGVDPADWNRPTVREHFEDWLEHRRPSREAYARAGSRYPVFVVAAEGGGIRAAYWTASVLAQVEDAHPGFACHVFAISGVSGGSLGAAVFSGLIADRVVRSDYSCAAGPQSATGSLGSRAGAVLGEDFLAPALAGMLFPDLMQRFLPLWGRFALPDRARYLEEAWEEAWLSGTGSRRFEESFGKLWASDEARRGVPSLFLNGTWVEDGGRNVTTNLRTQSSSFVEVDDALDALDHDIRLSTAVHMSARFTYLSPPGTVGEGRERRRVVDGGYFENSGALTAAEIVEALGTEADVTFHAIIISNDPHHPANPDRDEGSIPVNRLLPESLAPLRALFSTRVARGHHADRRLVETVESRVLRFQLPAVGVEKVPLGWMLSSGTRARMDDHAREHSSVDSIGELLAR